jgi:hypothetical protein
MNFKMQKANMLAETMKSFIQLVNKSYDKKNPFILNPDKWYQIKLLVEEFQFQSLADELIRINMHTWDASYTHLLVDRFLKGLSIIEEYIERNYEDLFILSGRIHTLKNLSSSFSHHE